MNYLTDFNAHITANESLSKIKELWLIHVLDSVIDVSKMRDAVSSFNLNNIQLLINTKAIQETIDELLSKDVYREKEINIRFLDKSIDYILKERVKNYKIQWATQDFNIWRIKDWILIGKSAEGLSRLQYYSF